jgi:hypothetical protein
MGSTRRHRAPRPHDPGQLATIEPPAHPLPARPAGAGRQGANLTDTPTAKDGTSSPTGTARGAEANRVLADAEELRYLFAAGIKRDGTPMEIDQLPSLDADLAVDADEIATYRRVASTGQLAGYLSLEEVRTIHVALGGDAGGDPSNGGWATGVDLALKGAITSIVADLMFPEEEQAGGWT